MPDTFPFTLPSGREIVMRYPDLWEMVFDDTIPDPLTGIVEGLITQTMTAHGMATQEQQAAGKEKFDALTENDTSVRFVQLIVERCVVRPQIVTTFEQVRKLKVDGIEALHVGQLDQPDIFAIYWKGMGVESALGALFQRATSAAESVEPLHDLADDAPGGVETTEHSEGEAVDAIHDR